MASLWLPGLNSFGFGGANAHVLLQAPVAVPVTPSRLPEAGLPPLALSAKSEGALARAGWSLRRLAGRQDTVNIFTMSATLLPIVVRL